MAWAKCSMTNAKIPIYGIKRLISSSDPAWERTDDAVGFTATASVGTVAGSSSFDKLMPWAGMVRSTFETGDVMVKIPEFWYRRWQEDGCEYIQIAAEKANSKFEKHPGSGRYIGAYETSSYKYSKSGAVPLTDITRPAFRTYALQKGTGWSLADACVWSAVTMLYLVEFASNDSQGKIGRGFCDGNTNKTNSGSCDMVPNLTGRPAGTDGKTGVVYRGIENPWGNIWEWVDGLNLNGGAYYVCTDSSKFADDTSLNYSQLNYSGSSSWSGSYITKLGVDSRHPWAMLPESAGSGSASTYYCDGAWSYTTTGWHILFFGGGWDYGSIVGLFASRFNGTSSGTGAIGSRLMYNAS